MQKSSSLNENILKSFLGKKSQQSGPLAEKRQDRKATEVGRKTREEIVKWN